MAISRAVQVNLDDLVVGQDDGMLGDCEVSIDGRTVNDLEKCGHGRGEILDTVEHPLREINLSAGVPPVYHCKAYLGSAVCGARVLQVDDMVGWRVSAWRTRVLERGEFVLL